MNAPNTKSILTIKINSNGEVLIDVDDQPLEAVVRIGLRPGGDLNVEGTTGEIATLAEDYDNLLALAKKFPFLRFNASQPPQDHPAYEEFVNKVRVHSDPSAAFRTGENVEIPDDRPTTKVLS